MSPQDILIHVLNFAAPALAVAVALPLLARFSFKKSGISYGWWVQFAINLIAGLLVLGLNLWWWGRDGKMAAYATLVLVVATSQWLLSRGWRR